MVQGLQRKHGSVEGLHQHSPATAASALLLVPQQLRKNSASSILHKSVVVTALLDLRCLG